MSARSALAVLVLLFAAACQSRGPEAGVVHVALDGSPPAATVIRVSGLSGAELRALAAANLDGHAWDPILTITVAGGAETPVTGHVTITSTAIEFRPAFPFDPGRPYTVRVNPESPPLHRGEAPTVVTLATPAAGHAASTAVTAMFPSGDVWPENMLRFYVHFSAPMSRGGGTRFVHLLDQSGAEIPDAILAAFSDLWNQDATRLTVFLDPGRVKRGIGPNVKMGRALVRGHRYTMTIDPAWPDAQGQPLAAPFRKAFTAGPAAYAALATNTWRLSAPRAGTRDALTVTFPAPLDRALLDRAIGVEDASGNAVAGQTGVRAQETEWTFVPSSPWRSGDFRLVALTLLEDPVGNKIGRAFEVLTDSPAAGATNPDLARVPFSVR